MVIRFYTERTNSYWGTKLMVIGHQPCQHCRGQVTELLGQGSDHRRGLDGHRVIHSWSQNGPLRRERDAQKPRNQRWLLDQHGASFVTIGTITKHQLHGNFYVKYSKATVQQQTLQRDIWAQMWAALTVGCMRYDWWCIQDGLCTWGQTQKHCIWINRKSSK